MIYERAAGEDVAWREIGLKPGEIVYCQAALTVLIAREAVHQFHRILEIESLVEPCAALGERPGKLYPRRKPIQVPATTAGNSGEKVGASKAPAVVPHLGLDLQRAGRTLPSFRGNAGAVEFQRPHAIDVHARFQPAGRRIRDAKTVHQIIGLITGASVEMRTAT